MMTEFQAFFKIGFDHIVALAGFDHILFIVALCAVYQVKEWRKILILVTAFTIGHSLTLILAALHILAFNTKLIEILIPVTIFITAVLNFFEKPFSKKQESQKILGYLRYIFALIFGFIHGFAFSNFLHEMFALTQESIVMRLLAFNLGIEAGQIVVVLLILLISLIFAKVLYVTHRTWNTALAAFAALSAVVLIFFKIIE